MTKTFTIYKKGNRMMDQMARVASEYTKWAVRVNEMCDGAKYISGAVFKAGLDKSDLDSKIIKRTKEFEKFYGCNY